MAIPNGDILEAILNYYEIKPNLYNGKIALKIADDISNKSDTNFFFSVPSEVPKHAVDIWKGLAVVNDFGFKEEYQEYVLSLLKSNGYYMKMFIIDLIKLLGNASCKYEREEIVDKYLKLPMIYNIKFNDIDEYTIESVFGTYSFYLADKRIEDNEVLDYLKKENRSNSCHENTVTLLTSYNDIYSITSLCKSYFTGGYYHSYSYIKEKDQVLDLCSNMLAKKRVFDDLYSPNEILFMRSDKIKRIRDKKIKTIRTTLECNDLLKYALYKQSQKLIFKPKEKKRILSSFASID